MMKVGFVGLGKLGLPVALHAASFHDVTGFDVCEVIKASVESRSVKTTEPGVEERLAAGKLQWQELDEMVKDREIIFVAVQTPHEKKYEGVTPLPDERKDFDYTYLEDAVRSVTEKIDEKINAPVIVVISTVLPGTSRRLLLPLFENFEKTRLVYNPHFIAMGSVIADCERPSLGVLGCTDEESKEKLVGYYKKWLDFSHMPVACTIEEAELIKVLYNTWISTKLAFTNVMQELCNKTENTSSERVSFALQRDLYRLHQPSRYTWPGMPDGGGCHPRDNIALSHYAQKIGLSYDWFEHILKARQGYCEWCAQELSDLQSESGLPVLVLGRSFKPNTSIESGAPALLLIHYLKERGVQFESYDPVCGDEEKESYFSDPHIYFIATQHKNFDAIDFPLGSRLMLPWRDRKKAEDHVIFV